MYMYNSLARVEYTLARAVDGRAEIALRSGLRHICEPGTKYIIVLCIYVYV